MYPQYKLLNLIFLFSMFVAQCLTNNFAHAQTELSSPSVVRETIANGQIILINGQSYVVEAIVGRDDKNSIVSLVPQYELSYPLGPEENQSTRFYLTYPNNENSYAYNFSNQKLQTITGVNQVPVAINHGPALSEGFVLYEKEGAIATHVIRGEYIASGGLNDVYQGQLIDAQGEVKKVAIKQGRSKWDAELGRHRSVHSLEDQKTLVSGAKLASELDSSTALEVYSAGVAKNQHGVEVGISVMEFQKGITLDQYVQDHFGKTLDVLLRNPDQNISGPAWDFLLQLQTQMEKILEDLKNSNIVHGDIKPGNLVIEMIDGHLSLRLSDFDTMGRVGTISEAATYNYLSPNELYRASRGEVITKSVDFDRYAMQSTLHKLVFGSVPYQRLMQAERLSQLSKKVGKYQTSDEFFHQMNLVNEAINDDWNELLTSCPKERFSKTSKFLAFSTLGRLPTSIPDDVVANNPYKKSSPTQVVSSNSGSTQPLPKSPAAASSHDRTKKLLENLPRCLSR